MTSAIASTVTLPAPATGEAHASLWRIYADRDEIGVPEAAPPPHYLVGVVGFPVMFYLLFGISLSRNSGGSITAAQYLLASYCVFGVVSAALFAFGAGVAVERAQGWMSLKRATPMPPSAYLGAKVFSAMAFGTIILVLVGLCGITLGGVHFPAATWLRLWAVLVLGCVPFCFAGLIIAFTVPPDGRARHREPDQPAAVVCRRLVAAGGHAAEGAPRDHAGAAPVPHRPARARRHRRRGDAEHAAARRRPAGLGGDLRSAGVVDVAAQRPEGVRLASGGTRPG